MRLKIKRLDHIMKVGQTRKISNAMDGPVFKRNISFTVLSESVFFAYFFGNRTKIPYFMILDIYAEPFFARLKLTS